VNRVRVPVVRLLVLAPLLLAALLSADLIGIVRGGTADPTCPSGVALVMGAAQYDGRPSPAFERRLERALSLYQDACVERIVVTGGAQPGDRTTEGSTGAAWLVERGVPSEDVTAETTSTTSVENVRNALDALASESVVIVSDDLHVWRASWLVRREGLNVSSAPVRSSGNRMDYAMREWMAMAAYRLGVIR
jgi:uncharacterized SAM-binding protein YcdF (DUF218 family)